MPHGYVKIHVAPIGRRKRPHQGPTFDNAAQLRGELMSKAKQKAVNAMFVERAKVAHASKSCNLCDEEHALNNDKTCLQLPSEL
jgi:hypothetical protein